jgi:hypothetical protein
VTFTPEQEEKSVDVPFFDDVSGDAGWQGQGTSKSIEALKAEVMASIGRLDIAVLPVKREGRLSRSLDSRRDKALKMALYMLRMAFDGQWYLQQLSPGYNALMPWMLADNNKTMAQIWTERVALGRLLPEHDSEFSDEEVE